jgi:hypothetical protein
VIEKITSFCTFIYYKLCPTGEDLELRGLQRNIRRTDDLLAVLCDCHWTYIQMLEGKQKRRRERLAVIMAKRKRRGDV